jgi:hypothetical protein
VSGVTALLRHSLRRWRGLLIATATVLAAFQIVIILTARDLELSGRFRLIAATMPAFMSQFANMGAASFPGFVLFGFSHPLPELFLIAMAIGIGSEPSAEIDTKFIDLVMARPLARSAPIVRTIAMLLLVTAGAIGCIIATIALGLRVFAPASARAPQAAVVLSLGLNLAALVLAWGGIALAMASISRRRATVAGACGLMAFAMFVLDYVGRFWASLTPASRVSPFHYYDPFAMIGGRSLSPSDVATLGAIFVAGAVFATVAYARRDL